MLQKTEVLMHPVLLLITTTSLFLNVIFIFKFIWTNKSKTRSILINCFVFGFTSLYLYSTTEFFFYYFFIQSDAYWYSLSSKRWVAKYWKPINSYGYRDIEHVNLKRKKLLFVVGDSFVAGHGIKDYRDLFSNVLAKKLGEEWEVINIAKRGWDTNNEYYAIISYPYEPDMIILSYYPNDIEGTATRKGFRSPVMMIDLPKIVKPFMEHSYSFNYFCLALYRYIWAEDLARVYYHNLFAAYSDSIIWSIHKKELLNIINFAEDSDIELIVIVFPILYCIEESKVLTSKIVNFLKTKQIKVIDIAEKLCGRDYRELIVNWADAHPNKALHKEFGELLYEYIYPITNF